MKNWVLKPSVTKNTLYVSVLFVDFFHSLYDKKSSISRTCMGALNTSTEEKNITSQGTIYSISVKGKRKCEKSKSVRGTSLVIESSTWDNKDYHFKRIFRVRLRHLVGFMDWDNDQFPKKRLFQLHEIAGE